MKTAIQTLTFIAACFAVSAASARTIAPQECDADADCPSDFICSLYAVDACPDCADEESCPPCVTETYGYCEPPPPEQCGSDADCEGGTVCVSYSFGACSGSSGSDAPCVPDEPCNVPPPVEECETYTEAYCVPAYYAPCQADADCGGGFTCEDQEVCSCTGGGIDEEGVGGDPGAPEPVDCECAPSGDKDCQLIEVSCDSDADCAQGLTCFEDALSTTNDVPTSSDDSDEEPGTLLPNPDIEGFCAPQGYWGSPSTGGSENSPVGDSQSAERVGWGESSGGEKADDGCTSAQGNASLGLFGLFALIAVRLRRR